MKVGIQKEIITSESSPFYTSESKYWEAVVEQEKSLMILRRKYFFKNWKTRKEKIF